MCVAPAPLRDAGWVAGGAALESGEQGAQHGAQGAEEVGVPPDGALDGDLGAAQLGEELSWNEVKGWSRSR